MKRIEVKLSLGVVAPLLDVIKSVSDSLDDDLAAAVQLERVDEDLRHAWRAELVASQNGDVQNLLALFDSEFFASGVVNFDESNADAILRACAAFPDDQRRYFMCYLFLATVQELVIEHLEPSIS